MTTTLPPSDDDTDPPPDRRRQTLIMAAGAAFVGLIVLFAVTRSDQSDAPELVIDIPLTTPDGSTSSLAEFEGELLMVNFFASWCAPCQAELPDVADIAEEFEGRVTVVGISQDTHTAAWLDLVDTFELTFPTRFEGVDGVLLEAVGGVGMPTTAFIDRNGDVVHVVTGLQSEESLRDLVNTELLES